MPWRQNRKMLVRMRRVLRRKMMKRILQRKKRRKVNRGGNSPMRKSMRYTNIPIFPIMSYYLIPGIRPNKLLSEEQ